MDALGDLFHWNKQELISLCTNLGKYTEKLQMQRKHQYKALRVLERLERNYKSSIPTNKVMLPLGVNKGSVMLTAQFYSDQIKIKQNERAFKMQSTDPLNSFAQL